MTDIYGDELYSPNLTIGATASNQMPIFSSNDPNDLFAQRLQTANQRLKAVESPVTTTSRDSPSFRYGSPLALVPLHDFSGFPSQEQNKAAQDARAAQQQMTSSVSKLTRSWSLRGTWDRFTSSIKRKSSVSSTSSVVSNNSICSQVSDDPNGPIYTTLQTLFDTLVGLSRSSSKNSRLSKVNPLLEAFVNRVAEAKKSANDPATNIVLTRKQST